MRSRKRVPEQGATLDARAVEAIGRFVRVLARCGCSPSDINAEVARQSRLLPASWASKARAALREMDDASHVLTLWFSDPAYLDRKGRPMPLPIRGPGGSLQTLVARVDHKLDPRELLRYLSKRKAIRRVGTRYLPKDRILSLRGAGGPDNFRHLRGLLGMLRTQEHNGKPRRQATGWYEVFAENPRFPISQRDAFDKSLRQWGNRMLYRADSEMHRYERARKRGERTVRMAVGIYRFEDGTEPTVKRGRKRRSRRT